MKFIQHSNQKEAATILIFIVKILNLCPLNTSIKMEFQESTLMEDASVLVVEKSECAETSDGATTECGVSDANEQLSPEFLQSKLYFLLEHLKKMHGELPE